MANLILHSVSVVAGAPLPSNDRAHLGILPIANAAGSGAGAAVVTNVTMAGLPGKGIYAVLVNPGQDATWFVTNKTNLGFTVTLNPRLAANTLSVGTFDVAIVA